MYKVTEKYVDYNGIERTEDFYFNLTKAELTKMQLGEEGGMVNMLTTLINKKDIKQMIKVFELIIDSSYGVKSPDGRKFIKNDEVLADFKATEAYSQIFTRFASDDKFAADFVNGIVPKDIGEESKKLIEQNGGDLNKVIETVQNKTA